MERLSIPLPDKSPLFIHVTVSQTRLNLFIRHSIQGSVTKSLRDVLRDACLSASMGKEPRSAVFRSFPVCFSLSLSIRFVPFFKHEPFATIPTLRSMAFWVYNGFILHSLVENQMSSQNFEKRLLTLSCLCVCLSVCLSVRPHGKIRLLLQGLLFVMIFVYFSKICQENSSLIKI